MNIIITVISFIFMGIKFVDLVEITVSRVCKFVVSGSSYKN